MAREKHDKKEALIRIVKRGDIARGKAWIIRLSSVLLALITGGLLILALGHNPFTVYAGISGDGDGEDWNAEDSDTAPRHGARARSCI